MQVIILRGLPGAGKSFFSAGLNAEVVSADDYYWKNGEYKYTGQDQQAHQQCWVNFKRVLAAGRDVVVDNTNTSAHEIAPYIMEAWAHGAAVRIVRIRTRLVTVLERNKTRGPKSVPDHVIGMMHQRMATEVLPPYWPKEEIVAGEPT